MAPLLISAIISAIVLIFILPRADIEIVVDGGAMIYISLIFFKYNITPKKKGIARQIRMLKFAAPVYKVLSYAIPKSDITVCENLLQDDCDIRASAISREGEPAKYILHEHSMGQVYISGNAGRTLMSLPLYVMLYSLLAPLSARAASFSLDGKNDAELYIKISIRVIYLIISAIIFLYYYIRSRIKKQAKA